MSRSRFLDLSPGDTLLVVVAHPDDEAFGCGSALLLAADAGIRTVVACATRGEAGEPAVPLDGADLGEVRERELRTSCAHLGVERVGVWAFADSGLTGAPPAGSLAATAPDQLAQAVRRTVAGVAPDALLTLDASDGHRDHAAVRRASEHVGREEGLQTYLSCLPRSLMRRWASWAHPTTRSPTCSTPAQCSSGGSRRWRRTSRRPARTTASPRTSARTSWGPCGCGWSRPIRNPQRSA